MAYDLEAFYNDIVGQSGGDVESLTRRKHELGDILLSDLVKLTVFFVKNPQSKIHEELFLSYADRRKRYTVSEIPHGADLVERKKGKDGLKSRFEVKVSLVNVTDEDARPQWSWRYPSYEDKSILWRRKKLLLSSVEKMGGRRGGFFISVYDSNTVRELKTVFVNGTFMMLYLWYDLLAKPTSHGKTITAKRDKHGNYPKLSLLDAVSKDFEVYLTRQNGGVHPRDFAAEDTILRGNEEDDVKVDTLWHLMKETLFKHERAIEAYMNLEKGGWSALEGTQDSSVWFTLGQDDKVVTGSEAIKMTCAFEACNSQAVYACAICKNTVYCSVEHQKADWYTGRHVAACLSNGVADTQATS